MKDNLTDIKEGDKVVLSHNKGYQLVTVTKTTPTQIIIGSTKYRRDGSEISVDRRNSTRIFAPLSKPYITSNGTMLEVLQQHIAKEKEAKQKLLDEISSYDFSKLSSNTLKQIISVIKG